LKPIVKTSDRRWKFTSWIVERFPENYREMTYLEPFLGDGSVFVHKDPSVEEVLNNPDRELMSVWRAVRDELPLFLSKIKRVKHNESTFKRHATSVPEGDYLGIAVREFVLRHMSKSGMKQSFVPKDSDKAFHGGLLDAIGTANERAKGSFLMCRDVPELLGAFDSSKTFVYFNSPELGDEPAGQEMHLKIGEILQNYRGKVLVVGPTSATYKRMYAGWNRKGLPGNPKDSAWTNF
jgi:DNA adenine methylase